MFHDATRTTTRQPAQNAARLAPSTSPSALRQIPRAGHGLAPLLLIADSQHARLEYSQRFFQTHGFRVTTSSGGVECLARLRENIPAALIVADDLLWGGSDGVLACLPESPETGCIPVILFGGHTANGDGRKPGVAFRHPNPVRWLSVLQNVRCAVTQIRCAVAQT